MNTAGFDFYDQIPLEERKKHIISYDFRLKNKDNKVIMVHQELTPLFLAENGKIWKALCIISLSTAGHSGNIEIYKDGYNGQTVPPIMVKQCHFKRYAII